VRPSLTPGRRLKPTNPFSPPEEQDNAMMGGLIRTLEASDQFRQDGRFGRIFHPGRLSYRELSPRDSLHIIIDGPRVSAHVDEVCPLRCGPGRRDGYSWVRVIAHNLAGLKADVGRRLRGVHGQQRCNLGCEMVWVDDGEIAELAAGLQAGGSCDSSGVVACSEEQE
jgi:hypothetical protein